MKEEHKNSLSHISSYSVIVFAVALFLSVSLDLVFHIKFMTEPLNRYIGLIVVGIGTFVIYWAEFHGRKFSYKRKRGEIVSVEHLKNGPYAKSRNPKYVGLGVLLIGLGLVLNSVFIVFSSFVSILIIHFFLLKKEEDFMANRHGDIYHEYRKHVRRWF